MKSCFRRRFQSRTPANKVKKQSILLNSDLLLHVSISTRSVKSFLISVVSDGESGGAAAMAPTAALWAAVDTGDGLRQLKMVTGGGSNLIETVFGVFSYCGCRVKVGRPGQIWSTFGLTVVKVGPTRKRYTRLFCGIVVYIVVY
jgi:hypothetical protein